MNEATFVVGISGGTCSGKSTIARMLCENLSKRYKVAVINMDNYYKWGQMTTIAPITRVEYPEHNHPDAVDIEALLKDFNTAISDKLTDIVIIEGIFALYFDEIREKLDLKIFVDLKSDERLYRRIKRFVSHGQSLDEIAVRYLDTVRHRHDEFVEPTRWHADIVLNGTLDANIGVEVLTGYVSSLREQKS